MGADDETYLRGTQVFLEAQANTAVRGRGLQNAAFWVGFRQEIHMAFINQRPFQFDLECCRNTTYKTLEPTDDSTWVNRIILHCAESLIFCHGDSYHDAERYNELWRYNQDWYDSKPPSFNPIYYRSADSSRNEVFPQIWYLGDCQGTHSLHTDWKPDVDALMNFAVTAIQHWHLARMLLAAFDPNTPRMGPNQKRAAANREVLHDE